MGTKTPRRAALVVLATLVAGCVMPGAIVVAMQSVPALRLQPVSYEPPPEIATQHLTVGVGGADVPQGYVSFCLRFADQCAAPVADAPTTIALTPAIWGKLNEVNTAVNSRLSRLSSQRHYGRVVYWNIPTDGYGDCEDFALVKRRDLIAAGMPQAALRMAVVVTRWSERCVVLTVATDKGDFVLNDEHDEIRLWNATEYTWIERQDPTRQYGWVWLNSTATDERLFAMAKAPPALPAAAPPATATVATAPPATAPVATAPVAPPDVPPTPPQPVALALTPLPVTVLQPSKPQVQAASVKPRVTVSASTSSGEQTIQLGAWRSQEYAIAARDYWAGAGRPLLGGLMPLLASLDHPGKGRLYHLRTGRIAADDAVKLCATLRSRNLSCLVVKN